MAICLSIAAVSYGYGRAKQTCVSDHSKRHPDTVPMRQELDRAAARDREIIDALRLSMHNPNSPAGQVLDSINAGSANARNAIERLRDRLSSKGLEE